MEMKYFKHLRFPGRKVKEEYDFDNLGIPTVISQVKTKLIKN